MLASAALGTLGPQVPKGELLAAEGCGILALAMPIYEYRCANEHRFEILQRFSDEPLDSCQICGAPAARVLYPAAIHFKGSGFYSTDYGRRKRKAGEGDGKPAEAGASAESKAKDAPKAAEA